MFCGKLEVEISMNQSERRRYLIGRLLDEQKNLLNVSIPSDTQEQKKLLRSLMNIFKKVEKTGII